MAQLKPQYKILVTPTSLKPGDNTGAIARLKEFAAELVFNTTGKPLPSGSLIEMLDGCDGVIAGLDDYGADVIRAHSRRPEKSAVHAGHNRGTGLHNVGAKPVLTTYDQLSATDVCADGKLKVISRYGTGCDNVDLAVARECGVTVCYTPGANSQAVADLTFGMMLCLARRLPLLDRDTKAGGWTRSVGVELYDKTMGVVGLGAVGKGVARRARGFSMRTLAYDPAFDAGFARENGVTESTLERLFRDSDFISLHIPLTAETRHIINRDALASFKPGAILINTARGGLIDEDAAYEALSSGALGGLGLDAYESEPPDASSPLFGLNNVILTPHTGSHTREAIENLADMSVENLVAVLSGRPCKYIK